MLVQQLSRSLSESPLVRTSEDIIIRHFEDVADTRRWVELINLAFKDLNAYSFIFPIGRDIAGISDFIEHCGVWDVGSSCRTVSPPAFKNSPGLPHTAAFPAFMQPIIRNR